MSYCFFGYLNEVNRSMNAESVSVSAHTLFPLNKKYAVVKSNTAPMANKLFNLRILKFSGKGNVIYRPVIVSIAPVENIYGKMLHSLMINNKVVVMTII